MYALELQRQLLRTAQKQGLARAEETDMVKGFVQNMKCYPSAKIEIKYSREGRISFQG